MCHCVKKQYGFTLIELMIFISIVVISLAIHYGIKQNKQFPLPEIQAFINKSAPELSKKMEDINSTLIQTDNDIKRLEQLKANYPRQAAVIEPRIQRWQQTKAKLLEIQKQIELQTERAFVVYQVNQGSKDFEQVAQGLIKQADEALNMAKQIESAVQETIPK